MEEAMLKAGALIEALPYIKRFQGKQIVVKFGGSAMEDERVTDQATLDIVVPVLNDEINADLIRLKGLPGTWDVEVGRLFVGEA